jgi:hypothetical protein
MTTVSDGKAALDALYWRTEILQAMFWMRGEGIDLDVEPGRLAEFLVVDAAEIDAQMRDLAARGLLNEACAEPLRYALSARGLAEGGRSFRDEFADLTHAAHYECAPGCWCHDPDHAGEPCPSQPLPKPSEPPPTEPDEDDADAG